VLRLRLCWWPVAGDSLVADKSPIAEELNVAWAMHEITAEFIERTLDWFAEQTSRPFVEQTSR
jgi:hypothetical protein